MLAENRHHEARKKAKAAKIVAFRRSGGWGQGLFDPRPITAREIGMTAATPHPCSCYMCGHRRKWDGPTVAEMRRGVNA